DYRDSMCWTLRSPEQLKRFPSDVLAKTHERYRRFFDRTELRRPLEIRADYGLDKAAQSRAAQLKQCRRTSECRPMPRGNVFQEGSSGRVLKSHRGTCSNELESSP